jgi:hypothetical protein
MGLLRRDKTLAERAAAEQERERALRASNDRRAAKLDRKGLERTAKTLGVEELTRLAWAGGSGQGTLEIEGKAVPVVLQARTTIRPSAGGSYEYRDTSVDVLYGQCALGTASYEWPSSFLSERRDSYRSSIGGGSTKAGFLSGIHQGLLHELECERMEAARLLDGRRPPAWRLPLSEIEAPLEAPGPRSRPSDLAGPSPDR